MYRFATNSTLLRPWVIMMTAMAVAAQAGVLFQDNFSTPGTKLNLANWTTEIGPPSFLGRTQLADWVTPGGVGQFVVAPTGAQVALSTFNPTGFSLYGTHAKTLASFAPNPNTAIEYTARLQLTSLQRGLVYGIYFYGCVPATCATLHDEIDIELVTNLLQPGGSPLMVQLNRYSNEPLGAGNGVLVNLPAGFDPLAAHVWTIRWSLAKIDYLLDGALLFSTTTHVPQGQMQVEVDAWGPADDWAAAFSASLQPVNSAAQNQTYTALLTSVSVNETIPSAVTPSIAVFRGSGTLGVWVLDNGNYTFDAGDRFRFFGLAGDQAVVGDWTGSGQTRLGVFRAGQWFLDLNNNGQWDGVAGGDGIFNFGLPGDTAVVGDWNGDGKTKLGIFRCPAPGTPGICTWVLDMVGKLAFDPATAVFRSYGLPGDKPIVSRWTLAASTDQIGVFRNGAWIVDSNGSGAWEPSDAVYAFGLAGDIPVVGNWNAPGTQRIGVFRPAGPYWVLDTNGTGAFEATDSFVFFGLPGDQPAFGPWSMP